MNVQNRQRNRRKGQAIIRTVLGLGTLTAGALVYSLLGVNRLEAIVVPGIVVGLLIFGAALYGRARKSEEWSAAWDAYAQQELARGSSHVRADEEIFSWAGTN
jgi:hypothetical protein